VELEVVDVRAHQVELRLQVVPEPDHLWPALALPALGRAPELVRVEPPAVELRRDVVVERRRQRELELAVQQALLGRAERDGELARGGPVLVGLARLALGPIIVSRLNLKMPVSVLFCHFIAFGPILAIPFAFLTRYPRKLPPRVGEPVGSGFDVFLSHPRSRIRVLEAFLTVGTWGRKDARGV
jgi:hypothetical protein